MRSPLVSGLTLAAVLVFCFPSVAGEKATGKKLSLEEVCLLVSCRPESRVKIRVDEQHYYTGTYPRAPYFFKGVANLIPGETLFLEVKLEKGQPQGYRYVPANIHPKRTLVFSFTQPGNRPEDVSMMLKVFNPLGKTLVYRAIILPIKAERHMPMSTCPVRPGKYGLESWPYPVSQLVLANLRFLPKDSEELQTCKVW